MSEPTIGQRLDAILNSHDSRISAGEQVEESLAGLIDANATAIRAGADRLDAHDLALIEHDQRIDALEAENVALKARVKALEDFHAPPPPEADVYVTVDQTAQVGVSQLVYGITPVQNNLETWDNPTALTRAVELAAQIVGASNQHLMGWGAPNPWPDMNGPINLGYLKSKYDTLRRIGKPLVLTACSAPDWMKGLPNGTTDWNALGNTRVQPEHYQAFAGLIVEVLKAIPDITAVQVWNEMKGFWNTSLNRWNYEAYTEMYNVVYDAIKAHNPNVLVGGPYMTMVTRSTSQQSDVLVPTGWIDRRHLDTVIYWNANKRGADFACVDGGYRSKDEGQFALPAGVDMFMATEYYKIVTEWVAGVTGLPVWWSEWYINAPENQMTADAYNAAIAATSMAYMLQGGAAMELRWAPEGGSGFQETALWTNITTADGGQPMPYYTAIHRAFHEHFSAGRPLYATTVEGGRVMVLASDTAIMLINQTDAALTVAIGQDVYSLAAYEVKVI